MALSEGGRLNSRELQGVIRRSRILIMYYPSSAVALVLLAAIKSQSIERVGQKPLLRRAKVVVHFSQHICEDRRKYVVVPAYYRMRRKKG